VANVGSGGELPSSLKISEKTFAKLKPVGSVVSTGEGRASVDFPETVGRYVMVKWHPATGQPDGFSIAQVAAFGVSKHDNSVEGMDAKDGKEAFSSGKEGKEALENPEAPAEGPPPALPPVPPFTFIPQVVPTSP
jgi:hypothetical protein